MTNHTTNEATEDKGLLAGKVVLVTGASRGIGEAAARLFAREGAAVVLTARSESALKDIAEAIRAEGGVADHVVADMADAASVRDAVAAVVALHGRLDGAFNNAGLVQRPAASADLPDDDFDLVNAVNYRGVWVAMSAEIKAILATAGTGAIVNTSSVGSLGGNPALPAYGAAKRAVNSLTESAAVGYGPQGVRVNAIAPGTTMTAMIDEWEGRSPGVVDHLNSRTPLGRGAAPAEVAEAAAWLLSDRASYVTGVVLPVDGGMSASF